MDLEQLLNGELVVAEERAPYGAEPRGFKKLRVYAESVSLAKNCYSVSSGFPKEELYGLTAQLRRAAVSISANVAEGWGRGGKTEFARFIDIAMGSLNELLALLDIAEALEYTTAAQTQDLALQANSVGAMLHKLRLKLRS